MNLLVPADLAQRVRAVAATTSLADVLARGQALLEHLGDPEVELAVALGDMLLYRTRLALAHHDLSRVSHEVWDLEEAVNGTRDEEPPTGLARELVPLVSLEIGEGGGAGVGADVETRDEDGGADDPDAALEHLCYGIGSVAAKAAERDGAGRTAAIAQARSEFAAAKFALFESRHAQQVLEFRRAGLRGMRELAQRSRAQRPPDSSR